jgi:hypothetical protein
MMPLRRLERIEMEKELPMSGYYIGFDKTGVYEIDKILSAIACAAKASHHTEGWCDMSGEHAPHKGETPCDWIQCAANEAAKAWNEKGFK